MTVFWRALSDVMVAAHYLFLLYLIVGGFIAWRWPKTIRLHVLVAIWGLLIITTHIQCPLTIAQNYFRGHLGLAPLRDGFIQGYVEGTLYPASQKTVVQILVAAVVLISWVGLARRHARHVGDAERVHTEAK